jgi:iron(III) transport system ATP-binding protein
LAERLLLSDLAKSLGGREVLRGLDLAVEPGETVALLGASGSGKTTLLNIIAGLDRATRGTIRLGDRVLTGAGVWVPPHRRGLGMVFQDQQLWPHMRAARHLDFVLGARKAPAAERAERIAAALRAVRLVGRDDALPGELSGGERQRLALARALCTRPGLLLLDEPCANLDAPLKMEILALLAELRATWNFTALYVTHDAAEAFRIAGRVAVLFDGRIVQTASPEEISRAPAAPEVARLIGQQRSGFRV